MGHYEKDTLLRNRLEDIGLVLGIAIPVAYVVYLFGGLDMASEMDLFMLLIYISVVERRSKYITKLNLFGGE